MNFSRSAVLRRWYFLSIGMGLAALLILRFTVLDAGAQANGILQSSANVTDNLIAATITSLIVGAAYVYLYPPEAHTPHEVVRSVDIAEVIAEQCHSARNWAVPPAHNLTLQTSQPTSPSGQVGQKCMPTRKRYDLEKVEVTSS